MHDQRAPRGLVKSLTLIRPNTFSNASGQMGSKLTPNIFYCSVTQPAVCFTILELISVGKVIDQAWALYQTYLEISYFDFFRKITLKIVDKIFLSKFYLFLNCKLLTAT